MVIYSTLGSNNNNACNYDKTWKKKMFWVEFKFWYFTQCVQCASHEAHMYNRNRYFKFIRWKSEWMFLAKEKRCWVSGKLRYSTIFADGEQMFFQFVVNSRSNQMPKFCSPVKPHTNQSIRQCNIISKFWLGILILKNSNKIKRNINSINVRGKVFLRELFYRHVAHANSLQWISNYYHCCASRSFYTTRYWWVNWTCHQLNVESAAKRRSSFLRTINKSS